MAHPSPPKPQAVGYRRMICNLIYDYGTLCRCRCSYRCALARECLAYIHI
jgi:hypothetical protein